MSISKIEDLSLRKGKGRPGGIIGPWAATKIEALMERRREIFEEYVRSFREKFGCANIRGD